MMNKINEVDYAILRFPGLKNINKHFFHYIYPVYENIPEETIKKYKWIIKKYYDYYDSIIGNLITRINENENQLLVIMSFYEYEVLPVWRKILLEILGIQDIHVFKSVESRGSIFFYEKSALKKDYPLPDISILDVFPTLLYYAELPIPNYLKGQVIKEMFREEFILRNPVNIETRGNS